MNEYYLWDSDYGKAVVVDVNIESVEPYIRQGGNDASTIRYAALPDDSSIRATMYLLIENKDTHTIVRTVNLGPYLGENQETIWDGKDDGGTPVPVGEYTATIG